MTENAHLQPFDELPHGEQIDVVLWMLGWIRWLLIRTTQRGVRHRQWYQRVANHEVTEIMKRGIIKDDPYVYRILFAARTSIHSVYDDGRPQFAQAACDDLQRAMVILRERKANS